MEVFDFHCDTLYKSMMNDLLLDADIYEFKISDLMKANKWHQCMAVWTPDDRNELPLQFRDKPLIDYFIASAEKLISECKRLKITFNDINANKSLHLTVENSSILEGNIENIEFLKKYGVKVATLTWNDSNCIGDGVLADKPKGATAFGKQVINEYIKNNIAIDVSHTSDDLFYDIASSNPKYILATHSNS
ncbi:MAG: membrane dipeptidase, partial [Ruminococcus sp.]